MEFPEGWRKANVTAVFRKYKKEDLRGYGPISFISVLVKLIEQIILETITKHTKCKVWLGVRTMDL